MRLELGINVPLFPDSPPTAAPPPSRANRRFFGAPQILNLGGRRGAVRLQGEEPHSSSQSAHRLTHSPFSPPPFKPSSRRPAPVWAQGGSRCLRPQPSGGRERGTRWGLRSGRPPQPAPGRVSPIDNGSGSSASRTRREKNKAGGGGGAEPEDPGPPHCASPRPPSGGLPLPPPSPP